MVGKRSLAVFLKIADLLVSSVNLCYCNSGLDVGLWLRQAVDERALSDLALGYSGSSLSGSSFVLLRGDNVVDFEDHLHDLCCELELLFL